VEGSQERSQAREWCRCDESSGFYKCPCFLLYNFKTKKIFWFWKWCSFFKKKLLALKAHLFFRVSTALVFREQQCAHTCISCRAGISNLSIKIQTQHALLLCSVPDVTRCEKNTTRSSPTVAVAAEQSVRAPISRRSPPAAPAPTMPLRLVLSPAVSCPLTPPDVTTP
jgi:hypothetical protein